MQFEDYNRVFESVDFRLVGEPREDGFCHWACIHNAPNPPPGSTTRHRNFYGYPNLDPDRFITKSHYGEFPPTNFFADMRRTDGIQGMIAMHEIVPRLASVGYAPAERRLLEQRTERLRALVD